MHESHHPSLTPRLGISACLLGEPVRFNGGHKRSALCEELARHVEFVSFCPEQAIGLGTPRPAIRLEGTPEAAEARSRDGLAVGGALAEYARRVAQRADTLDGFIFMQRSPSCGLQRVKVYPGGARARRPWTLRRSPCEALPELPVEEEGRLHDPVLRENFSPACSPMPTGRPCASAASAIRPSSPSIAATSTSCWRIRRSTTAVSAACSAKPATTSRKPSARVTSAS